MFSSAFIVALSLISVLTTSAQAAPIDPSEHPWDIVFNTGIKTADEAKAKFKSLGFEEKCNESACTFVRAGISEKIKDKVTVSFDPDQPEMIVRVFVFVMAAVPEKICKEVASVSLHTIVDPVAINKIKNHRGIQTRNTVTCTDNNMVFSSTPIPMGSVK